MRQGYRRRGFAATQEYTRVAVLSDIHGVLPALEAVLAEPEVAAAEAE